MSAKGIPLTKVILMKNYNLNIAGYNIGFESSTDGPDLKPSSRFQKYINQENRSDILIRIHNGPYNLPEKAEMIFHAPYFEEIQGLQIQYNMDFWSILKHRSDLFIKTVFPLSPDEKKAVLKFSLTTREWDIWINGAGIEVDPLEYPLDSLILYYLSVIHGDIMIHASGVNNVGHGYLFSGVSGKGKSTMAKLWQNSGARVIHDDRLILKKTASGYMMFNTPIYNNDEPNGSPLNKIFLIEHGNANEMVPVRGAAAVSLIMANCIQHNWGSDIIARLMGSISIMCGTIPTVRLSFKPDWSVIDHILENE
jgi:hypothetical protein